jgi:hypothetical protein
VDLCGKKDEENLHVEKLPEFYSSPDVIRVMKPKRIRWADHVACMGVARNS